jgi:cell division protein FtsQ
MRKALQILIFVCIAAYLVIALGFADSKRAERKCNEIRVIIPDGELYQFFDNKDVERIIRGNGLDIKGYSISEINTRKIEEIFRKSSYVRKVEVFFTVDGVMNIRIRQRIPVVRIITDVGATYYIDKDGYILPASRKFAPHVLVASGDFNMGDQLRKTMCLNDLKDRDFYKSWTEALELAKYINNDDFLTSQIVQIYLNSKEIFELIPRVGAHQIIIGDASDLENKFFKLEVLYKEGLNNEGWNKYQKIDLRFKNQIICTKR